MNHATAQMNPKLAHQAAFHQHSIGAPPSSPVLNDSRVHTRTSGARGSKGPLCTWLMRLGKYLKMTSTKKTKKGMSALAGLRFPQRPERTSDLKPYRAKSVIRALLSSSADPYVWRWVDP